MVEFRTANVCKVDEAASRGNVVAVASVTGGRGTRCQREKVIGWGRDTLLELQQ